MTFGEFSRIFTPSMSTTLVSLPLNDTYLPNCQPSQENYQRNINGIEATVKKIDEIRVTLAPDPDPKLEPATRYGAKPPFRNTFVNF